MALSTMTRARTNSRLPRRSHGSPIPGAARRCRRAGVLAFFAAVCGIRCRSRRDSRRVEGASRIVRSPSAGARTAAQRRRGARECPTNGARCFAPRGADRRRSCSRHEQRDRRIQSRHLGGVAGHVFAFHAGPESVSPRRISARSRSGAGQARFQSRRIRGRTLGQRRRQVRGHAHRLAHPGEHRLSGGSLRDRDRAAVRTHAQVRPVLLRTGLYERAASARLGLRRCAARLQCIPRRSVRQQRRATQVDRADR